MIAGDLDFTIKKGCTFLRSFNYLDENLVAVPITGWTPQCDCRVTTNGTIGSAVIFDLGASVTNGATGEVTFEISDEDTALLDAGTYTYDLIFGKPDGTRTEPIIQGMVTVVQVNSQHS